EEMPAVGKEPWPAMRFVLARRVERRDPAHRTTILGHAKDARIRVGGEYDVAVRAPGAATEVGDVAQRLHVPAREGDAPQPAVSEERDGLAVGRPEREPGTFRSLERRRCR